MIILLFLICFVVQIHANGRLPVIGVVANSYPINTNKANQSIIFSEYVRWIEDAGGLVVPIFPWMNLTEIDEILSKVNGVLWQGGMRDLDYSGEFEQFNFLLFEKIFARNVKNITMPLWLTCQGFELIHILLLEDNSVLSNFTSWKYMIPIEEPDRKAKIFSNFDQKDLNNLITLNTTVHYHNYGVSPDLYDQKPDLKQFFNITSYGRDRDGKRFVATIESSLYPFYGVQFHPEELPYNNVLKNETVYSTEAIKISQLFGLKFIEEARKSPNTMSESEMEKFQFINTMEQLPQSLIGESVYLFNK